MRLDDPKAQVLGQSILLLVITLTFVRPATIQAIESSIRLSTRHGVALVSSSYCVFFLPDAGICAGDISNFVSSVDPPWSRLAMETFRSPAALTFAEQESQDGTKTT